MYEILEHFIRKHLTLYCLRVSRGGDNRASQSGSKDFRDFAKNMRSVYLSWVGGELRCLAMEVSSLASQLAAGPAGGAAAWSASWLASWLWVCKGQAPKKKNKYSTGTPHM